VEPSSSSYGTLSCTKNVSIVGPGYFLGSSQNAGLQANSTLVTLSSVYFTTGSAGASIAGLTLSDVHVGASSMQRNCLSSWLYVGCVAQNSTNLNLRQNCLYGISYYSYVGNNVLVTNKVVASSVSLQGCSGELANNVVLGSTSMDNFNVRNNSFTDVFTPSNNIYSYNTSAQAGFP
jgi:hypothetical protein